MADRYVFADEAGNMDFSTQSGASKYFILCTITMNECHVGQDILHLRRDMAWRGISLDGALHATTDQQAVRDEVFDVLSSHEFRVDATILEKRKTRPHLQTEERFYQMAWWLHFKHVALQIAKAGDRMLITAASLGTKKKKTEFHNAVKRVAHQVLPTSVTHQVAFWPFQSDPCLQAADYCTWAIQRKWEQNDPRSHVLIENKIFSEYDVWQIGKVYHYS